MRRPTDDPSPRLRALLLPSLLLGLAACGGDEADDRSPRLEPALDTIAGVERLLYPESPGEPLDWTVDTVTVLGDAFAEEMYQFNNVTPGGLAAAPDDGLLVLDRQGNRVLEYGPDGSHRKTYGREGEGPGELTQPLGLAVGPGDTVWVSDFSNARLTGYPMAGGEPRLVPLPDGFFPSSELAALGEAFLIQLTPLFTFGRGSGGGFEMSRGDGAGEDAERRLALVRYGAAELEPLDTLATAPEPPRDMVQLEMRDRLMVTMMSREFWPEFEWAAFSDGGAVVSDTAAYVLRLVNPDGTVRRLIERAPTPRATTEADREAARQRLRDEFDPSGGIRIGGRGPDEETQRRMLEQRIEKMTFAETVPRVLGVAVDLQDRIWVAVAEDVADELARLDIYDRDGVLIGELRDMEMPDVFLAGDRIGMLYEDELDVQHVAILQLERAEAPD